MCTCSQPLDYSSHSRSRPIITSSYDRHAHPTYSTAPRTKRYYADTDTCQRCPSAYTTTARVPLSSRRRSTTPPPVLIQSTPMGRPEVSPRLSPGGRFSRSSGLDSPTSSIRSGEMGFNQPMVLQDDGMGPIIHQGGHYQAPHHTNYAPHVHSSGVRGNQRRYSVNASGDERTRNSYIGYRSDHGSIGSDEGYGSDRRMYTNEVRRGYGGRNSGEGYYSSTPIRRYS